MSKKSQVIPILCVALFCSGDAPARDLVEVLPSLYGGDGITLADTGHSPHFNQSSLVELADLAEGLTGALSFASLNSSVTGFTFDVERGVPVQTQESLGPLLAERASTIGARRLNLSFTYTNIDYDRFEGTGLDEIRLVFPHSDTDSAAGLDSVLVDLDIHLKQDVFALFGTYGLLPRLDVGVVVPIIRSDLSVDALGTIDYVGTTEEEGIHLWDPSGIPDGPTSSGAESRTGIGDVIFRTKYHFRRIDEGWMPETAIVLNIKTPTGDEDNLHGTGDTRILPMLVVNKAFDWFTPHLNAGFEFVPGHADRQNVKLLTGFDARLHERVTLASDFLGRFEVHKRDGIGDDLLDVSFGGKLNVWKSLLLIANFIVPINGNEGLRSNLIWSLGFEYTFGDVD
jgi:hypothetical protein